MKRALRRRLGAWLIGGLLPATTVWAGVSDGVPPPTPPSTAPATDEPRDDELAKKLIRRATTGADADVMSRVTLLMSEAEDRLVRDLDPGPETQAVQVRILQSLDDAIKMALQQRSPTRAGSMSQGERRELPKKTEDEPGGKDGGRAKNAAEPAKSVDQGSGAESALERRGAFRESRRGWGHLPQRDREELLQGIEEEFIEQYRPQIEQYYRALTEEEAPP